MIYVYCMVTKDQAWTKGPFRSVAGAQHYAFKQRRKREGRGSYLIFGEGADSFDVDSSR